MKRSISIFFTLALVIPILLTACSANKNSDITASGTLSALEVSIAPEVSGRVVSIVVSEGDSIKSGNVLFRIDDELLQGQYDQAKAAADAAAATLEVARAQLLYAQKQRELVSQGARAQNAQARQTTWSESILKDFQPAWYFQKSEKIIAAQNEVDMANEAIQREQLNLKKELEKASNQDFISTETRLSQAQAGFTVAKKTLDQAKSSNVKKLIDAAKDNSDLAQSELDAARLEYKRMLTTNAAETVLKARAKVAVTQARYDNAIDVLNALQTGDESNQVSVADASVEQAKAAVTQGEANVTQVNASLKLIKLQLDRTEVKAPVDGILLTRDLEVGEIAAAGGIVMTIGQLDEMKLTVYIPEDRYGQVSVGQQVEIKVDSFPAETFIGSVVRIADQAEYTPRNVQTSDSRASTVYAVEINVPNLDVHLKPGMPADVKFIKQATK